MPVRALAQRRVGRIPPEQACQPRTPGLPPPNNPGLLKWLRSARQGLVANTLTDSDGSRREFGFGMWMKPPSGHLIIWTAPSLTPRTELFLLLEKWLYW